MGHARRATSAAITLLLLTLVWAVDGCQLAIDGGIPPFRCEGGLDAGVCPAGQYCIGQTCAVCETVDVCDGRDNDCDGQIDNGSDRDGDGYTICGRLDEGATKLVDVDCADDDPNVKPGAPERCNGKDDDCDGLIDNGACQAGQICAPKTGECVDDVVACTEGSCPSPQVCDPGTRRCAELDVAAMGSPCKADPECMGGSFCGYSSVLTDSVVRTDGVCTRPCCTSSECPTDFVCYGAGTGGSYCVGKDTLGRATLGASIGGASCGSGGDCRSGVCGDGRCEDTCCRSDQCGAGTTCRLTDVTGPPGVTESALGCDVPEGSGAAFQGCRRPFGERCAQGVCHAEWGACVNPCCGSESCGAAEFSLVGLRQLYCDNVLAAGSDGPVLVCGVRGNSAERGPKGLGESCTDGTECRGGRCYSDSDGSRYCSDACCTDADCGQSGLVCRPYEVSDYFFLRCLKP